MSKKTKETEYIFFKIKNLVEFKRYKNLKRDMDD